MDWDVIYRDLRKRNWIILLILSSVSYFLMSPFLTIGVILGGFIIIANFNIFQHTICRVFLPQGLKKRAKIGIIVKYQLRLLALGVILYVLVTRGWADPVGLGVGLSTVVISIVSFGISSARKDVAKGTV